MGLMLQYNSLFKSWIVIQLFRLHYHISWASRLHKPTVPPVRVMKEINLIVSVVTLNYAIVRLSGVLKLVVRTALGVASIQTLQPPLVPSSWVCLSKEGAMGGRVWRGLDCHRVEATDINGRDGRGKCWDVPELTCVCVCVCACIHQQSILPTM